jgi:transposase
MWRMAMGTRQSEQASLWVASAELPKSPGHPFYTRLNALLDADDFDRFVEGQCAKFYAPVMGRPSLAPGRYFLRSGSLLTASPPRSHGWRCFICLPMARECERLGWKSLGNLVWV